MRFLSQVRVLMVSAALTLSLPLVSSVIAQQEDQEMEMTLALIQQQWEENSKSYSEQQQKLEKQANKIRYMLCQEGKIDHCPEETKKKIAKAAETEKKTIVPPITIPEPIKVTAKVATASLVTTTATGSDVGPVAYNVDLDALAYAIAIAETSNCTAGTGKSKNNCHGIFGVTNGKYGPRTFLSTADSFAEFKRMWLRVYGDRFPTLADAQKYTANEGTYWLRTVTVAYNRYHTNETARAQAIATATGMAGNAFTQ